MKLRNRLALPFFLAVTFFAFPVVSGAQEMVVGNDAGVGARAMGMGGAYTAISDDASAIYYNPAGLAQMRRIEWNLGMSVARAKETSFLRGTTGFPTLGSASATTTTSDVNSFGGVFPLPTYRGSLVFAAAYNRVKDFDSKLKVSGWSDIWIGDLQGQSEDAGGLNMWSLAGAVDVSPTISLGASLDYLKGDHTLAEKRAYYSSADRWAELFSSGYTDHIKAWSLQGGMLVRTAHNIRLGATLRLPVKYKIKSTYYDDWYARTDVPFTLSEHASSSTADSSDSYTGGFSYYVKAPMQMNMGISWVYRGLTLSGDATWLDWSQSETDLAEPEYTYRNTMNWRIGAETVIPKANVFLRAGYSSTPDPYTGYIQLRETVRNIDRNRRDFLTLGAGMLLDPNMMLDISLMHGFWSSEEAPRTDEATRDKLFVTLSYRL